MPVDYTRKVIVRKDKVDKDKRTPAKDDASEDIAELWGLSLSEIAERTGYSRQHIKNALDDYYNLYDEPPEHVPDDVIIEPTTEPEPEPKQNGEVGSELPIDVPDDVDRDSFIKGWVLANDVEDMDSFYKGYMARYMDMKE